jgi:redox-sensitive bicupin YhaK (pirin superfamily)
MKTIFHSSGSRGRADHGWLKAKHSFSFASYFNPAKVHFGALRVLNDDIVMPSMGFGTHPHDNMEIITIPLKGAVKHKDSTGTEGVIHAGDVQIMSAGSGIFHSEYNASSHEILNLLQIWIFPKMENIQPRYAQKTFDKHERINKIQTVVSPEKNAESLWINQDAFLSLSYVEAGKKVNYQNFMKENGIYLFVINGKVKLDGRELSERDAIGISEVANFDVEAIENTELLFIEVPMIELTY